MAITLEAIRDVSGKYKVSSDLMQNAAAQKEEQVKVSDTPVRAMTSHSPAEQRVIRNYNEHNQNTVHNTSVSHYSSPQMRAEREQHQETMAAQRTQTNILQNQTQTLRQIQGTMADIRELLDRQANKQSPKYQDFSNAANAPDIVGGVKEDGAISKMGGLLGDLLGGGGGLTDFLRRDRGRRDRKEREKAGRERGGREPRANRQTGGLDRLKDMMRGRLGGIAGAAGAAGAVGSGAWGEKIRAGIGGARAAGGGLLEGARDAMRGGGGVRGKLARGAAALGAGALAYFGTKEALSGLGSVSEHFESGGRGVGTVSSGAGDAGGVSYGKHQLASANGSMAKFLRSDEGAQFAPEFAGLQPGSAAFNQKYKEVVANNGAAFDEAQSNYIGRTHYAPQAAKVSEATGVDMSKRGKAVQEMLFSTGVQYGPGSSVVVNALRGKDVNSMSDAQIVDTVQNYKADTVGQYFRSSSAGVQQSVANRAAKEKQALLTLNDTDIKNRANPSAPVSGTAAQIAQAPATTGIAEALAGNVGDIEDELPVADVDDPTFAPVTSPSGPDVTGVAALGGGAAAVTGAKLLMAKPTTVTPPPVPIVAGEGAVKGAAGAAEKGAVKGAAKGLGRGVARAVPGVNVALTGLDVYDIATDDTKTDAEKNRAYSGVAGGFAGGAAGAAAGAAVGSVVPVVGTAIGGIAGGIYGYYKGSEVGEGAYDAVAGSNNFVPTQPQSKPLSAAEAASAKSGMDAITSRALGAAQPQINATKGITPIAPALAAQTKAAASTKPDTSTKLAANTPVTSKTDVAKLAKAATDGTKGGAAATVADEVPKRLNPNADTTIINSFNSGAGTTATPKAATATIPAAQKAPVPSSSPASPSFYNQTDIATSSLPQTATSATVASAGSMPASPAVASSGGYAEPVQRQAASDVQKVMMIEPRTQDTMMPDRMKPEGGRIPTKGTYESGSIRTTLDEVPVVISANGLVLLQTGFV